MSVRADATSEDLNKKLKEVTETLSEKWEETDDKPAVITLGVYALIGRVPRGVGGGGDGGVGSSGVCPTSPTRVGAVPSHSRVP